MIINSSLYNINKNEEALSLYETQLSTGKQIQAPSDDPITAIRALKFGTTVNEIEQYQTNAEDAESWLTVTEQAISNTEELLQSARELCVQASSDTLSTSDREIIMTELAEIKTQILSEGNVDYAGRYVFGGFKTDTPLSFLEDTTDVYEIEESFTSEDIETDQVIINDEITDIYRIRLGYSDVTEATVPSTIAGFTINEVSSSDSGAYEPAADTINFIKETGELIFNSDNVDGTSTAIPDFDFTYKKSGFEEGDLVPEHYFNCTNLGDESDTTDDISYTKPDDEINYRISGNQDITVNTLGNEFITSDLMRDFEELFDAAADMLDDDSITQALQEDLLGSAFEEMLTKLDDALDTVGLREAEIGAKINRIDLTINRLEEDSTNFTELLSSNEDVDYTEAVIKYNAYETVYNASLMASADLMQQSLLDFIS
jgi:flagellar hook-associated protein 3 FlgL